MASVRDISASLTLSMEDSKGMLLILLISNEECRACVGAVHKLC